MRTCTSSTRPSRPRSCGPARPARSGHEQVAGWVETIEAATNRCLRLLGDIINSGRFDLATLSVALREIRSLVQASTPETGSNG